MLEKFIKNNMLKIFNFIFFGGLIINLTFFVFLDLWQLKLSAKVEELQQKEIEISNREYICSLSEQYVSMQNKVIEEKRLKIEDYESFLKEKNESLQEQAEVIKEKADFINNEAEFIESLAEEVYSSSKLYIPTPDEINDLLRLVFAEAGNQSYEGKLAVAEVVFNRVKEPIFPSTIDGVIFDKNQFSPCNDGKTVRVNGSEVLLDNISDEIKSAVLEAWLGSNLTESLLCDEANALGIDDPSYWDGGALYFANPVAVKNDVTKYKILSSPVKVMIEDHVFRRK